jgi:hypothetical protein
VRYSYEIGTSPDTMVNVESLASTCVCVAPQGLAVDPVSVRRVGADGQTYGDGYPTCRWFFSAMQQAQLDALLAYFGTAESVSLYIRTRQVSGAYALYQAVAHRPIVHETLTPRYASLWADCTIRFTMLVLVPEES